jgi:methyl-accepting chemotaxis protein
MGVSMRLSHFSVKTRIYLGFGCLLVLAVSLAGFGVDRMLRIGTQITVLGAVTDNTSRAAEATFKLESIRRALHKFKADSDPAGYKDIQGFVADTTGLLTQSAATTRSEDRRRIYNNVEAELRSLLAVLDRFALVQAQLAENRAKLFSEGDVLTASTGKLTEAAENAHDVPLVLAAEKVERAVLLVRVANWRFLATNDPKGPATFKTNHDTAEAAITALEQMGNNAAGPAIPPIRTALAAYAQSFDRVATAALAADELFNQQLAPKLHAMQEELGTAKDSLAKTFAVTRSDSEDAIANTTILQSILIGMALVFGVVLAFVIGRGIANPIRAMTATMSSLANGDFAVEIPARDGQDEIGAMARAVDVFKANMIRANTLAAEQAVQRTLKETRQQTISQYIETFDHSVRGLLGTLGAAVGEMRTTASAMSDTADQTNRQAGTASIAAQQASANVQTMAAATEEMAASASEIARQVARSTAIAGRAVEAARNTDHQVQGLADTAQKIEAVVAMISNIASQTNLLALNATIEAARAGEAGKGFAVVASEVKALASQTGRATAEIGGQIQAIQTATQAAVEAIKDIGATINEMNDISTAIAAAMAEQGATTSEMTRNTQDAARGTQDVSATIHHVSGGAEATGAAANRVLSSATELNHQTEKLRLEVDGFLDKIRAA